MNGHDIRRQKWETINWLNPDPAIAAFLSVDRKAVAWQRRRRGVPRYCGPGGNTKRFVPYRPLTPAQLKHRLSLPADSPLLLRKKLGPPFRAPQLETSLFSQPSSPSI